MRPSVALSPCHPVTLSSLPPTPPSGAFGDIRGQGSNRGAGEMGRGGEKCPPRFDSAGRSSNSYGPSSNFFETFGARFGRDVWRKPRYSAENGGGVKRGL